MKVARITRKNPSTVPGKQPTYRIPFASEPRWREMVSVGEKVILGEVADKLGKYEDIGEPEEILRRLGER